MKVTCGVFRTFVGFCAIFVKSTQACEYAPLCPDLATWKPGFICDDDLLPNIQMRAIDGELRKTICCKAVLTCSLNFWCSFSSNSELTTKKPTRALSRPSCDSNCAQSWKPLTPKTALATEGVRIGLHAPGVSSFVGRTFVKNELHIGRIQLAPTSGLFYALDGVENFTNSSIEFLAANDNFSWRNSSKGAKVDGAVTYSGKNRAIYVGRATVGGLKFLGSVVRATGMLRYSDEAGISRTTDCYEVLACSSEAVDQNSNFMTVSSNFVSFARPPANGSQMENFPTNFGSGGDDSSADSEATTVNFSTATESSVGPSNDFVASQFAGNSTASHTKATKSTKRRRTSPKFTTPAAQSGAPGMSAAWLFTTKSRVRVTASTTEGYQADEDFDSQAAEFACAPKWTRLSQNASFIYDGVDIGVRQSEHFAYVARVKTQGKPITPGRVDLKSPKDVTFNGKHLDPAQIEYLARSHTQTYAWQRSSNGDAVRNAISLAEADEWPFYVGQTKLNGKIFIGKVLPSVGLKFSDRFGSEKFTKFYEVLVCTSVTNEAEGAVDCRDKRA